jgi:hypothetical protein
VSTADSGDEEGGRERCVPQDAITAKDETYGETDSPSHEGAHSTEKERIFINSREPGEMTESTKDILHCSCGERSEEVADIRTTDLDLDGSDEKHTFLPDGWFSTMSRGRWHFFSSTFCASDFRKWEL